MPLASVPADWADREAELRGEAADLEARLRQAEGAAQALQTGAGDATRPLLRCGGWLGWVCVWVCRVAAAEQINQEVCCLQPSTVVMGGSAFQLELHTTSPRPLPAGKSNRWRQRSSSSSRWRAKRSTSCVSSCGQQSSVRRRQPRRSDKRRNGWLLARRLPQQLSGQQLSPAARQMQRASRRLLTSSVAKRCSKNWKQRGSRRQRQLPQRQSRWRSSSRRCSSCRSSCGRPRSSYGRQQQQQQRLPRQTAPLGGSKPPLCLPWPSCRRPMAARPAWAAGSVRMPACVTRQRQLGAAWMLHPFPTATQSGRQGRMASGQVGRCWGCGPECAVQGRADTPGRRLATC